MLNGICKIAFNPETLRNFNFYFKHFEDFDKFSKMYTEKQNFHKDLSEVDKRKTKGNIGPIDMKTKS